MGLDVWVGVHQAGMWPRPAWWGTSVPNTDCTGLVRKGSWKRKGGTYSGQGACSTLKAVIQPDSNLYSSPVEWRHLRGHRGIPIASKLSYHTDNMIRFTKIWFMVKETHWFCGERHICKERVLTSRCSATMKKRKNLFCDPLLSTCHPLQFVLFLYFYWWPEGASSF